MMEVFADYIKCDDCEKNFHGENSVRRFITHRHVKHGGPDYHTQEILTKIDYLTKRIDEIFPRVE